MKAEQFGPLVTFGQNLKVGQSVQVRWGYGLGFRARGVGVIAKIFGNSVQVKLTQMVKLNNDDVGWPEGYILRRIPRSPRDSRWHAYRCVLPVGYTD